MQTAYKSNAIYYLFVEEMLIKLKQVKFNTNDVILIIDNVILIKFTN